MAKHVKSKYLILVSGILLVFSSVFYLDERGEDSSLAGVTQKLQSESLPLGMSDDAQHVIETNTSRHQAVFSPSDAEIRGEESNNTLLDDLRFSSIEDLLDNIEDPQVQSYIESLPIEAQESIYIASLKQSVSKRLDDMEETGTLNADQQSLLEDIDTLSMHGVMMPGEVESLKAYIRTKL